MPRFDMGTFPRFRSAISAGFLISLATMGRPASTVRNNIGEHPPLDEKVGSASPSSGLDLAQAAQVPDCDPGEVLDLSGQCVTRVTVPGRVPCQAPDGVRFGSFELKHGGRMVQVWCHDGWALAPQEYSYAMCRLGQWDRALPRCVRPGCEDLTPPANGRVSYEMDRALAAVDCDRPYVLEDGPSSSVMDCDGQRWNVSVPRCVAPIPDHTGKGSPGTTTGLNSGSIGLPSKVLQLGLLSILQFKPNFMFR